MISLSLGHFFMSLNSRIKRWPSDKLIIFVRFVNCCTSNSIHKAFVLPCYTTDRPYYFISGCIDIAYRPWPHSDISPFSYGCFLGHVTFLHPRCFCLPYIIHFCCINLDNTKATYIQIIASTGKILRRPCFFDLES